LRLLQQLKTIPLFIDYFLNVVDQHSIQTPFAFRFYTDLSRAIKNSIAIKEIENARNHFLRDHSIVEGEDLGAGSRITKESRISSISRHGISSKEECIFLFELANICKPETCIELGTSLGIVTAYLSMSKFVNTLYTFEGNKILAEKASQLLSSLHTQKAQIIHGNINEELLVLLETLDQIGLAIIDANHTEKALLNYYELLKPKMNSSGIIVIDDIRWSVGMNRGWKKLIGEQDVTLSIEYLNKGLLFFKNGIQKQHYVLRS